MIRSGKYGVLNIVLHPHPAGSYRRLFEETSGSAEPVNYYGERYAKISPISETRDGIFTGRLATWTEIDTEENLIKKDTLNELLFSQSNIAIPRDIGFNSRVFSFAFRVSDHRLFVELVNDENQKISIGAAQKIFLGLLNQAIDGKSELNVHVVSKSSSWQYVLETPQLRKLEVEVQLPNPDVLSASKKEILDSMKLMKAKKMRVELTRQAGEENLEISPGVQAFVELSTENGFSKALGRDADGKAVARSTEDFPLEVDLVLMQDESRAIAARRAALSE